MRRSFEFSRAILWVGHTFGLGVFIDEHTVAIIVGPIELVVWR